MQTFRSPFAQLAHSHCLPLPAPLPESHCSGHMRLPQPPSLTSELDVFSFQQTCRLYCEIKALWVAKFVSTICKLRLSKTLHLPSAVS